MRVVRGKGDIHDWQVKCVDEACNNGWMRELEERAKPLLLPLVRRQQTALSPNHRRTIAGWAVLKAIIGEYETGMISWSPTDLARLQRIQLPPARDCFVWAATVQPGDWNQQWLCYAFPAVVGKLSKEAKANQTDFNSAATTQIVGSLLLHVVHGPLLRLLKRSRCLPEMNNPNTPLIWPVTGRSIDWSAAPISRLEGHQIATGLYEAIKGNVPTRAK